VEPTIAFGINDYQEKSCIPIQYMETITSEKAHTTISLYSLAHSLAKCLGEDMASEIQE
jgi:hypothetical protein